MSRSRRSVTLGVCPLEDRLTPAYIAASVADFIRSQRIVTGSPTAVGAVFNTWEPAGPAGDPNQRLVDPREASFAVRGLLLSGNESTPGDNLATTQRFLQWYLLNVDSTNGYVIQQQWYRDSGAFVRTTAPNSESPYIAAFFQTAWDYVRLGGDATFLTNPAFQVKVVGMANALFADRQTDNLFASVAGGTTKSLQDNAEIYAGLLSVSRLFTVVYSDATRAFGFDNAAVKLRDAVRLQFYGGPSSGYGWTKNGSSPVTTADDAANPWVTQAVRLAPAVYGIDDPRGQRSTDQLAILNTLWSSGSKDWVRRIVDVNQNPWTVTGYAQNAISGDTTRGLQHNDYIYDLRFGNRPLRPLNPVTSGDAGWMLRTGGPFNLIPVATAQTLTVDQGGSVPVTLVGTDPEGAALHYTVVMPPTHGTFKGSDANTTYSTNNAFTYTPLAAFSGVDTLLFKVSDGQLDSDYVTVTLAVTATPGGTDPGSPPTVPGLPPVTLPPTVPGVPGVPPAVPGVPPAVPPGVPGGPTPPLTARATLVSSPTSGSAVTVVTDTGVVRSSLFPLDAVMPGGVRTALADVNGDGTPDYVAGSGPGAASAVVVVSGATNAPLFRLTPFEGSFTGGVFVAAGDLTGDGVPDIAVSADQGGGPRVRIFDGKTQLPVVDFFGIDDRAFRGGARIGFGDVTGDGKLDLIVAAGFGGGPRVTVWDGQSLLARAPRQVANFFAFEPSLRNGVYVAAGNFVGNDGKADIVVGAGPGGGPRVSVFSGSLLGQGTPQRSADFFSGDVTSRGGVSVAAKPGTNGDTLITGDGPSGAVSRLRAYAAPALAASPNAPSTTFDIEPLDGNASGIFVG